jgi:hypothetical protein
VHCGKAGVRSLASHIESWPSVLVRVFYYPLILMVQDFCVQFLWCTMVGGSQRGTFLLVALK